MGVSMVIMKLVCLIVILICPGKKFGGEVRLFLDISGRAKIFVLRLGPAWLPCFRDVFRRNTPK